MGILDRFRRTPDAATAQPPIEPPPARLTLYEGPGIDVVGEFYYQDALEAICGRPCSQGYMLDVIAELRREPNNPHDRNAVAVIIDGRKVGHLSREDAPLFHRAVDRATREHGVATCRAQIRGGWDRGADDTGTYGVTLLVSAR